jgi:LmbE family N-acetylglucosaminyl deacetylase
MLSLSLDLPRNRAPRLLVLGAHSDDIEIGCGGTVRFLLERHPGAEVRWVVFAAGDGARAAEARGAAARFLRGAGEVAVETHRFRDGFFPAEFTHLKEVFEALKAGPAPDLVLTHRRLDHHQDHRQLAELTWNTFRDTAVLEYEIPKYDPDLGNPNLFVPLTRAQAEEKVAILMEEFPTQRRRAWFTPDTFTGLMRLRGVQCNAPSGFAEGFHASKLRL